MKRDVRVRRPAAENGSAHYGATWLVYLQDHRSEGYLEGSFESVDEEELLDLLTRLNDAERKCA